MSILSLTKHILTISQQQISPSFTRKTAAKISWLRYETSVYSRQTSGGSALGPGGAKVPQIVVRPKFSRPPKSIRALDTLWSIDSHIK